MGGAAQASPGALNPQSELGRCFAWAAQTILTKLCGGCRGAVDIAGLTLPTLSEAGQHSSAAVDSHMFCLASRAQAVSCIAAVLLCGLGCEGMVERLGSATSYRLAVSSASAVLGPAASSLRLLLRLTEAQPRLARAVTAYTLGGAARIVLAAAAEAVACSERSRIGAALYSTVLKPQVLRSLFDLLMEAFWLSELAAGSTGCIFPCCTLTLGDKPLLAAMPPKHWRDCLAYAKALGVSVSASLPFFHAPA
jgi:hypothetical protein